MYLSAIYCRVSTDSQEESGSSLPYQQEACLQYAKEHGLILGKKANGEKAIFLESFSGGYYERPELLELLSLVKSGKTSSVIFTKRDRVARDQYVFQRIKKEIEEAGGKMLFAEEKLTGDTAIDSFMGSTIVGFAEWEREQIKRRTHAGKVQHARENKWAFSSVPFGYIKNPLTKKLEIFEEEKNILLKMIHWYLYDGYSLDKIAVRFTEEGVLPPSSSSKKDPRQVASQKNRKNAVSHWSGTTVYRLMSKYEVYTGVYYAFTQEYKKIGGKSVLLGEKPKDEWVKIEIPPIISIAQAEKIQEKLIYNKQFSKKRSVHEYALRGKLFCDCEAELHNMIGYTGQKIIKENGKTLCDIHGNKQKKHFTNYRCGLYNLRRASEERHCSNHISGIKIEAILFDTLKELFANPHALFDSMYDENETENDMKERVERLKEKTKTMQEKLQQTEELYVEGLIDMQRMRDLKEKVQDESWTLEKLIQKEERCIQTIERRKEAQVSWDIIRADMREAVDTFFLYATEEQKRALIDLLVDKVLISHKKENKIVTIRLKIPFNIDIANRYYEDETLTWEDDYGKSHIVATYKNLVPKKLPLSEIHNPVKYKQVEFLEPNNSDDNNENSSLDDPMSTAINKLLDFLRSHYEEKYIQSYKSDH